jgi:hypothetical protein
MQGWAETQVKATEKEIRQQPSMHRQGKKNSAGMLSLGPSPLWGKGQRARSAVSYSNSCVVLRPSESPKDEKAIAKKPTQKHAA